MELRQSPKWGAFLEKLSWQTEIIGGCALRIKKLGRLGSIIKIQRPDDLPLEKIDEFARTHRVLFVKIEPKDVTQSTNLQRLGYHLDKWLLTPARTVWLNLIQTKEELLEGFSKDTRQTLKRIKNSELEIKVTDFGKIDEEKETALKNFYQMWQATAKRGNFWATSYRELRHKVEAFGSEALLITALSAPNPHSHILKNLRMSDGPLAECLLLFYDGVAYYHHAASTDSGQKQNAPYAVMWRAALESKQRGMKKLDLEGIFDRRFPLTSKKRWVEFSTFKLKWGGQIFEYPGAYTKAYNPLVRLIFSLENWLPA